MKSPVRGHPTPFPGNAFQRAELIELLKSQTSAASASHFTRADYRYAANSIEVAKFIHPGGGVSRAEVLLYNLSASGGGVVYNGYLHPETECELTLKKFRGGTADIKGVVRWCDFVTKQFHMVGIKWDEHIDIREFIDPRKITELGTTGDTALHETLKGRVLVIEDDNLECNLIRMMLSETEMGLEIAQDTGAAFDRVRANSYDLIITDSQIGSKQRAVDFMPKLRHEGFAGPVIAIARDNLLASIDALRDAGASEIVCKPFQREELHDAIRRALRETADPASGSAPIYSSMKDSQKNLNWIIQYVDTVHAKAKALETALRSEDVDAAMEICSQLQGTGQSYGFAILSETALAALTALRASSSCAESTKEIRKTIRIIERLAVAE
ncbi:MAG: response regulator [Phycisphaeraceae bacterium]|nr:response regulator [Phycisphaerales bacterium]MCB9859543.1 response regulator [Phycisphaeraceae bacterium]